MVSIVKEVEIGIDDFDDDDLVQEIKWRGLEDEFFDYKNLKSFRDDELIDELEERGFTVLEEKANPVHRLYTTYLTMPPDFFQKELIKFFQSYGHNP